MFFYEGQKCPVCGNYFGEKDDIVTCPECGAPHHRNCWKAEGHCHFAELHGTDKQWHEQQKATETASAQPTPKKRCSRCGYDNPEFAEVCARCGLDLGAEDWHTHYESPYERPPVGQYTPPRTVGGTPFGVSFGDPYGGVPRNETIDGVPVDTVAKLVGSNTAYYLPRFYRMTHGGSKISWNWMAFLLPYNWFLYRKNIVWGALTFVLLTICDLFTSIVNGQLFGNTSTLSAEQMMRQAEMILATQQGQLLWAVLVLLFLLTLAFQLLCGLFGNYLYMRSILRKAKKAETEPFTPYEQGFFKSGGVSFALAVAPELLKFVVYSILEML